MSEPKLIKTWDALPPIIHECGIAFSTRYLERQYREMERENEQLNAQLAMQQSAAKPDGKHEWKCISPGMYDSLYKCEICHDRHMQSIDNPATDLPEDGCIGGE